MKKESEDSTGPTTELEELFYRMTGKKIFHLFNKYFFKKKFDYPYNIGSSTNTEQ